MIRSYLVRWEIDITAENPKDAAKQAQQIQRDLNSWAQYFTVVDSITGHETEVELEEE